jgi:hypothetical protein
MAYWRTAFTLLVGSVAGVAATRLLWETPHERVETVASSLSDAEASEPRVHDLERLLEQPAGVAERAQVYDLASQATFETLEETIDDALRAPPSPQRELALAAFAARAAELDPAGALDLLNSLNPEARSARALGLVVLESLPIESASIDAVIDALSQIDAERFEVQAIAQFAAEAPERALEIALAIVDDAQRIAAASQVARVWAEQDPFGALARAERIEDEDLRTQVVNVALGELAHADVGTALEYVEQRHPDGTTERARFMRVVVDETLRTDPGRALTLARQIGGQSGDQLEWQAVDRLAKENPLAAFSYTEGLPPGNQRRQLRESVARAFGQRDPDAALAWVDSFNPPTAELKRGVLAGVARVDPLRAIELARAETSPDPMFRGGRGHYSMLDAALTGFARHKVSRTAIAEHLLAIEEPKEREEWIQSLASVWARMEPQAALAWLVANHERVGTSAFREAAQSLAQRDPTAAMRHGNQLPAVVRDAWIDSVTGTVSMTDPSTAVEWLSQFRGEAVYERAASAVVRSTAWRGSDPARVTELFATLSETEQMRSAESLGNSWGRTDVDAGMRWAMGLPSGALRDSALRGLLTASERAPDRATLALFESAQAREAALIQVVSRVATRDLTEARRLMAEYGFDPSLRARVEYDIQQRTRRQ